MVLAWIRGSWETHRIGSRTFILSFIERESRQTLKPRKGRRILRSSADILSNRSDTDLELLASYARHHAEEAFAELVHRHLGLVFSAALRQVRSPQLAEEVAQSIFTGLAREADHFPMNDHANQCGPCESGR